MKYKNLGHLSIKSGIISRDERIEGNKREAPNLESLPIRSEMGDSWLLLRQLSSKGVEKRKMNSGWPSVFGTREFFFNVKLNGKFLWLR